MLVYHEDTTTIGRDLAFLLPLQLNEEDKQKKPNSSAQNSSASLKFYFVFGEVARQEFPNSSIPNTSASVELNFAKEIESGITQELTDTQTQRLAPPTYDEEDVLNWDVAITPPPRPSGIIRVKLKFKGRRKPMPIDNPWEE